MGAVVALIAAGAALAPPAVAAPRVNGVFPVTGVGTNNQITLGPDGNMWVTLDSGGDVARITPAGQVTEYNPVSITSPVGITAGPDGNLWVTQANGVARFSPANPAGAVATTINDIADPRGITTGPDGNLWTASGDKVIRIPPANPGGFTTFASTGVQGARAISSGRGFLWVADFGGAQIVRVSTAGTGKAFPTGGGPQGVAASPKGTVAFADPGTNPQTVGLIRGGAIRTTRPTPNADPFGVARGSDRAFWVAQFATDNLGRLTASGAYSRLAGLPAASGPRQVARGRGKTVWVTLDGAEAVARISGVVRPRPNTTITKAPKPIVRTSQGLAKAQFRFTSTVAGSRFQCSLVKQGGPSQFRRCSSPKAYERSPGTYVFRVRALAEGKKDPTPARRVLQVVNR